MGWFSNLLMQGDTIQMAVPASADTISVAPSTTCLVLNHPTLIALLTINFPSNPPDGQRLIITSGAVVTALTLSGGTIKGGLTTMVVNGFARYIYSSGAGAWFRTG